MEGCRRAGGRVAGGVGDREKDVIAHLMRDREKQPAVGLQRLLKIAFVITIGIAAFFGGFVRYELGRRRELCLGLLVCECPGG